MDFEKKKQRAQEHAERVKQRQELKALYHGNDVKKKLPTTKLVLLYMLIILNAVLVYSMWAMIHLSDLSALSTMITDIAGQVVLAISYFVKSTRENTIGGITYESALQEWNKNKNDEAVG